MLLHKFANRIGLPGLARCNARAAASIACEKFASLASQRTFELLVLTGRGKAELKFSSQLRSFRYNQANSAGLSLLSD